MGGFETTKDDMPGEPTEATHRLESMFVQEVSLVDLAANKRKFLTLKRASNMTMPVKKENAAQAAGNIAEQAATDAANTGAATSSATGDTGTMQAQVKEEITGELADVAEQIIQMANQIDGVQVSDQPSTPPVPASITSQISDLGAKLTAIAQKYGAPAAAAAPAAAGKDAATSPEAKADDGVPITDAVYQAVLQLLGKRAMPKTAHERAALAQKIAPKLALDQVATIAVLEKAGRRMAKERLERLGKAIDMLITLLKELRYDNEKRAAAAARAKAQKSATAEPDVAMTALLADAEVVLEALTKAENEKRELRARIVQLEKSVRPSNVIPFEQTPAHGAKPKPMLFAPDMNDLVKKRQQT